MFKSTQPVFWLITSLLQRLTFVLVIGMSLALVGLCLAAAFGAMPWFELRFGAEQVDVGMWVQIGATIFALGLASFLPSNARIMRLETSHRRFHIGMQDVAQAYAVSHAADRRSTFRLKSEFDSVRERIAFLRDHPDLSELEPSVLEVAAQMSHVSRDLASTYSDAAVARAQDFLTQRQDEIETFNQRIDHAKAIAAEIRQWIDRIDVEESVARSQMSRLSDELRELMPEIFGDDVKATEATHEDVADTPKVTPILREAAE